jgi:chromosome segregation ATPase
MIKQKSRRRTASTKTFHRRLVSLTLKTPEAELSLTFEPERRKEDIAAKKEESNEYQKRMQSFRTKVDHASMRKAKMVLNHKEQVDQIRICHEQLLDAEIRLIEAKSDAEALEERNTGIVESLERERQNVRHANEKLAAARATAEELAGIVADIMEEARRIGTADYFKGLSESPDTTVETLHAQITAEEMQLQYIHATNPNAIEQFERRQIDIDKLKAKIHEAVEDLERMNRRITKTRSRWEPELDKLVAEISDAFSYNFESIGCAGQVGIHKDEDFEQWAIQIKVKFRYAISCLLQSYVTNNTGRENEALQILDQHRQSGGERSVSTIFYLMALQSLARSPFRVVDEINQGMDPRNERMVHERMVEIACKEHTSQYFLITPKLLTNLRYDRRMKVHCIASGEYMPEDHKKMDVRKVITIRRAMVAAA